MKAKNPFRLYLVMQLYAAAVEVQLRRATLTYSRVWGLGFGVEHSLHM